MKLSLGRVLQKLAESVMKDLKADWRRWTQIEKIAAALTVLITSSITPGLLLLSQW
jgi:hypothetical protein